MKVEFEELPENIQEIAAQTLKDAFLKTLPEKGMWIADLEPQRDFNPLANNIREEFTCLYHKGAPQCRR